MAAMAKPELDLESAARLTKLRRALKLEQRQMASLVGASYHQWNNWERGYPVPREWAKRIKENVEGVDLDFILDGDMGDLSPSLRKAISELPNDA